MPFRTFKLLGTMLGVLLVLISESFSHPISADADWKAGLARVDITPAEPVWMAGYSARNKPSEGILANLYAKVLALEDTGGNRAVLVTADLIGFRAEFAEAMCRRIMERHGIDRAQILLNASHTHTGPMPALETTPYSHIPEGEFRKLVAYTRDLQDRIVQAVDEALSNLEPARLSWGWGLASFMMNRREHTPRGIVLGVNPRGPVDRTVPVLRLEGPDGTLRGVLFGAACHNTTLTGEHYHISGDYAGFAQNYLEEEFPSALAMFMTGCGGDANPYPRGSVADARRHGQTLGQEVQRVLQAELQPVRAPLRVGLEYARLPLQPPPPREELTRRAGQRGWESVAAQRILQAQERGERLPTHYRAPIAVWQFGEDLTLVGLSGEVVVDYVALLEKALGPLRLWVAAYCNDVFGYLPSARILEEGGYETRGLSYGGVGLFAPQAQDVVVDTVRDLARRLGR